VHCLEPDRRELADAARKTPAVVGRFDPDRDRQAHLLSRARSLTSSAFFLEQGKNDSMAALSAHVLVRSIDRTKLLFRSTRTSTFTAGRSVHPTDAGFGVRPSP
jgi:hypothetical protein